MIHTLTLNPTLDLTYETHEFREDDTTRAHTVYRTPGGKGINVARVATRLGHPTIALGFLGGHTGSLVLELLQAESVTSWFVTINGETRINPIIQDHIGRQIRISAPGPKASQASAELIWQQLFALRQPDWLLASGSKPTGLPEDFYAQIIKHAKAEGIRTVVDADGAELKAGIEAGADLIKPNKHELERLIGTKLNTFDEIIAACHRCLEIGAGSVAASLGSDGALFVQPDGVWHAVPPAIEVGSSVGAGDSFLAGLCSKLAEGLSPLEALRFAVACGSDTARTHGTQLCTLAGIQELLPHVQAQMLR